MILLQPLLYFTVLSVIEFVRAGPKWVNPDQITPFSLPHEHFQGQKIHWQSLDEVDAELSEALGVDTNNAESYETWINHTSVPRTDTSTLLAHRLRILHPNHHLSIVPSGSFPLFQYVSSHLSTSSLRPLSSNSIFHKKYSPPSRRLGGPGFIGNLPVFAGFELTIGSEGWIVYTAKWHEMMSTQMEWFIFFDENGNKGLGEQVNDALILEIEGWGRQLHEEVLVFDQYWQKNHDLWKSVQGARWEDIILDSNMKDTMRSDVEGFFQKADVYKRLNVAYKRGIIFRGPPGNGKSFSLKAIMNYLHSQPVPIPVLYVKSFRTFMGDEAGIRMIFTRAREEAPCLLVLEDLDSLINDQNRSFFLNEVDGLESNDGVLMIGTTNHFNRLDPALKNRPSRFDRKYDFPDPVLSERIQYCKYWQKKLKDQKEIEFEDELLVEVAKLMEGFSFAFMKEAFVSTLLVIAGEEDPSNLPKNIFGKLIKEQIESLRKEMESGKGDED